MGQQEQPQASLFSMAFYSYVILLLTHIGIGAVAHGGGSQRRARTLSKEPKENQDSGPSLSQLRLLAWPRESLICGSPPHWPLPSQLTGERGEADRPQHCPNPPPQHWGPPPQTGSRNWTVSQRNG